MTKQMNKYVIEITVKIDVEVEAATEDNALDMARDCDVAFHPTDDVTVNGVSFDDYEIDYSASDIEEDD